MIIQSAYSLEISGGFEQEFLNRDSWLVILHASRIPPHIGILIEGNYNSLTIKGHELNVSVPALIKMVQQKKIEALFIRLKHHPVFSFDYQREVCQMFIQQYHQVKPMEATCLSPVKLFLQEFYALPIKEKELLFELLERLKQNNYLEDCFALNLQINNNEFCLPQYSSEQLQEVIQKERKLFYKD